MKTWGLGPPDVCTAKMAFGFQHVAIIPVGEAVTSEGAATAANRTELHGPETRSLVRAMVLQSIRLSASLKDQTLEFEATKP